MITRILSLLIALLIAAALPTDAMARQGDATPNTYLQVDCMKSTSPRYAAVERDIWQPMHQHLVDQGKKVGWSLYRVAYGDRSECDYYTVNSYAGEDQLNGETSYADVFAVVHGDKDGAKAMEKTAMSRQMVRSELWVQRGGTAPAPHRYARVNYMSTESAGDWAELENTMFKPVADALVGSGHSAGWGAYQLWAPSGEDVPYNVGTVDFFNALGPVPWQATIQATHPDVDVAELMEKTEAMRTLRYSATWELIAATN